MVFITLEEYEGAITMVLKHCGKYLCVLGSSIGTTIHQQRD